MVLENAQVWENACTKLRYIFLTDFKAVFWLEKEVLSKF